MSILIESATITKAAIGFSLGIIGAAVAINAFYIITVSAELARSHSADISESRQLVLIRLVGVIMCARVVGAVSAQEMNVAHLHFLEAFHFV